MSELGMLGTSARVGEVLAIRLQDLDLDGPIPTALIARAIISRKGDGVGAVCGHLVLPAGRDETR